jgi:hypothetical protein
MFSLMLLSVSLAAAVAKDSDSKQPEIIGVTQGNTGCMILGKHMATSFYGVVYSRTQYTVLQTFNYEPQRQKYTGQGQVNELNQEATKNRVKLVVVPLKYKGEEMDRARELCQGSGAASPESVPSQ